MSPGREVKRLRVFLQLIERHFILKHLGASTLGAPSQEETLDVAAYVVLAHGALEDFMEGVSLWVLGRVHDSWQFKKRATRSTASLLLHLGDKPDDYTTSQSVFDSLRLALHDAKSLFSRHLEQNHGIAMNHLRSLFRPLGIDVPETPTLVASLELLVSMRHEWAHQYRFGAKTIRTASDVRTTVADCVAIAESLAQSASKIR
jgi:hypothetical protein